MLGDARQALLTTLADVVTVPRRSHPTRVAIDGRSAAGKTTLADELAEVIQDRGREVLRASIDDFHRPGHKDRSRRGDWTPRAYFNEGYDYIAFRELLLEPLGCNGSRRCRTKLFDAARDDWYPEAWQVVGNHAVAIIDGVFLLRPDLAPHWDYIIWLDIDMETMVARARRRDVAWVGSAEVVEDRYRRHWIPTHELYERIAQPHANADIVIDNQVPEIPTIRRLALP